DGQAKFQEDGHSTYDGAVGVASWELHRNRIGISGHLFKKIEYEVERELTEKELTEKDILAGVTPASHWKDVNVNLTFMKNAQFRPFASGSVGAIEIGSAFTISALSDDSFRPNGLRGRTVVTQDTFAEPVYVKGHRRRWEADADWTSGPFSARTEYTWESDDRTGQGLGDEDLPDARARAWYVTGTWVVTGEDKKRPLKPAEDFLQGGWG